jgi:membrane fusion protein, multidrug efflux system
VTALPEEGTTLEQGDVIAWIDNQPVVLLYGELPVWREMRNDTEGPDVLQLETALTALGYNDSGDSMTVDQTYSAATGSVVETWQEVIGAEVDGVVGIGEVVFSSGPVRVDALEVAVGDQVAGGSPIFSTSGEEIEVTFDLPTFEQDNVEVGDAVEITMPDLSVTTGVVREIAAVATIPEEGGQASFLATVELDDPSVAEGIDDAPVTVAVITDRVDKATAVPVEALVALAEGGYALEVEDGSVTDLVAVEPGFYADGLVEVTGGVSPGDRVVVP